MTSIRQDIENDFYAGNSKIIRVLVKDENGSAKSLTDAEITYCMVTDPGIIVLSKSSAAGTSEIEIVDGPGGELVIKLVPSDTTNLAGTYRHQVNVVDSSGYEETVTVGKVNIWKSFARRYRKSIKHAFLQGTT